TIPTKTLPRINMRLCSEKLFVRGFEQSGCSAVAGEGWRCESINSSDSAAKISFEFRPDRIAALSGASCCISRRTVGTRRRHGYLMLHATIPAGRSVLADLHRNLASPAPPPLTLPDTSLQHSPSSPHEYSDGPALS